MAAEPQPLGETLMTTAFAGRQGGRWRAKTDGSRNLMPTCRMITNGLAERCRGRGHLVRFLGA